MPLGLLKAELEPDPEGNPLDIACDATACSNVAAKSGLGDAAAAAAAACGDGCIVAGVGVAPGTGLRYMLSIVGRKAAPKGVDRKSDGRLDIQEGMDPPVRKPTQSLVKELQLKSRRWYCEYITGMNYIPPEERQYVLCLQYNDRASHPDTR